jgi:hypothetical protein
LIETVQSEGLIVYKRDDEEKRAISITDGEVAFFALLASDMLDLAEKYKRDVDDVHRMFFEVSCDRDKLVKLLEGKQSVQKWEQIEDLAVKDCQDSMAYKYVMQKRGENEVAKRRRFLEYDTK